MKTLFAAYTPYSIIALLLFIVVAVQSLLGIFNGLLLVSGLVAIELAITAFLRSRLYQQLLIFLTRQREFTFAGKASYGVANSTILT